MRLNNKKKIIFIITGVVLVTLFLLIFASTQKNTEQSSQKDQIASPFRIDGLDNPDYSLSTNVKSAVTKGIESILDRSSVENTNLVGVVRKNSYEKNIVNDGTVISLLIDLPTVKRTYKASLSKDPDGYGGLYILCPSSDEMIYPVFECKDETDE